MSRVVTLYVVTDEDDAVVRTTEAFGRALAGLALEGLDAHLCVSTVEDDEPAIQE